MLLRNKTMIWHVCSDYNLNGCSVQDVVLATNDFYPEMAETPQHKAATLKKMATL